MTKDSVFQYIKVVNGIADSFRDGLILILIAIFISFYISILTGWFKPIVDLSMLSRIEPLIFLFIGYYFGRLPADRNEKVLKEEILRQTHKADAAFQLKERAACELEVFEEKVRNAKRVLLSSPFSELHKHESDSNAKTSGESGSKESGVRVIGTAISILSS